ncbi:unnamed protein product, partial [Oikopleura dioica]
MDLEALGGGVGYELDEPLFSDMITTSESGGINESIMDEIMVSRQALTHKELVQGSKDHDAYFIQRIMRAELPVLSKTDRGRPNITSRSFLVVESGYTKNNYSYCDTYLEVEEEFFRRNANRQVMSRKALQQLKEQTPVPVRLYNPDSYILKYTS